MKWQNVLAMNSDANRNKECFHCDKGTKNIGVVVAFGGCGVSAAAAAAAGIVCVLFVCVCACVCVSVCLFDLKGSLRARAFKFTII